MASFEEKQKAKIAASYNLDPIPGQLLKAEADELEKGGKRVPVGTIKGNYIKTSDGWKYHGKGKTGKAQEHVRGALEHHTHKDATDHLVEEGGKHYIDTLDPDSGEKKFKPGDKVRYKDDAGKEHKGTLSNREHPDGDMYEVDKDEKSTKSEEEKKIDSFLDKFPNNATSWSQATDEIRDLARTAKEYYNEMDLDLTSKEVDAGKGLQPLNFREIKTPSEWNTKGKEYIKSAYNKMSERTKKQFFERFQEWFK